MKIGGDSLEEVLNNYKSLKSYKPYQYGGKGFLCFIAGQGYFYRNKQSMVNKAAKNNITKLQYVEIN